jgi:hypothetical protein
MTAAKRTKKGGATKGGVAKGESRPPLRSKLPDEDDHHRRLDRARGEKERQEVKRMRDVLAASTHKPLR